MIFFTRKFTEIPKKITVKFTEIPKKNAVKFTVYNSIMAQE